MAQKTTRERRAEGRASRRATTPEAETPAVDAAAETAPDESGEAGSSADALKTAASAALAAAAVEAARAFAHRRKRSGAEPAEGDDVEDEASPEEHEEPQAPPSDSGDAAAGEAEVDAGAGDEAHDNEREPEQRDPVPAGRARSMIDTAKQHLRDLRGADAEAVSSVRRTGDGWRVALDVVEVHRVPDSTDVLGTYELDLDDDGELITLERTGRFYRSEADRR
jgi:hypothetical protein